MTCKIIRDTTTHQAVVATLGEEVNTTSAQGCSSGGNCLSSWYLVLFWSEGCHQIPVSSTGQQKSSLRWGSSWIKLMPKVDSDFSTSLGIGKRWISLLLIGCQSWSNYLVASHSYRSKPFALTTAKHWPLCRQGRSHCPEPTVWWFPQISVTQGKNWLSTNGYSITQN